MFHLSHVLERATEVFGERRAVSDGAAVLTYRELGERVGSLARGLSAWVGPGDRVLLLDRNSFRALELNYACAALGAILVPLNTRLAAAEIEQIATDVEPALVLASDRFASILPAGRDAIVWPGADPPGVRNAYEELASQPAPLPVHQRSPADIAQIFYTSGTTGVPKGVCLTHGNLVASAIDAIIALDLHAGDVWLHAAPMFHLVDAFAIWGMSLVGGTHAIAHFQPGEFADIVAAAGVTKTSLPPTLIAMATERLEAGDPRLSSLVRVSYGGSPMTEAVYARAQRVLGAEMLQAYGITEASGIVCHQLPGDYRAGGSDLERRRLNSAGRPTTSIELRLAGEDGALVEPGDLGEIQVAGARVMTGYWRAPEATHAAVHDGWYHTGDLGRRDADGHVFIVGRKKDMVITGGENVYPSEVENVLAAHPSVAEVAIFGIPSERWGEEVRAAVVLRPGCLASESELLAFCRERIGGYKVPKAIDFRREPLPTTGPGKVAKHLLRQEYAAR